jgi:hypothetical protein
MTHTERVRSEHDRWLAILIGILGAHHHSDSAYLQANGHLHHDTIIRHPL